MPPPTVPSDRVADLVTKRLVLRPLTAGQVDAIRRGVRLDGWADDFPDDGDLVIAGVLAEAGGPEFPAHGFGHRQLVERGSGLVVGGVGFLGPPQQRSVELGYGVVPSRRGRGYATEAVRAMLAWAFADPAVQTVTAGVEPANVASVRVLEKAGLRRVGVRADGSAEYEVRREERSQPFDTNCNRK